MVIYVYRQIARYVLYNKEENVLIFTYYVRKQEMRLYTFVIYQSKYTHIKNRKIIIVNNKKTNFAIGCINKNP